MDQMHPVLTCVASTAAAIKDVADVEPTFMRVADKKAALLGLAAVIAQLEELQLRVLSAAADVADDDGARDTAAWLAHHARISRGDARRRMHLADALTSRRPALARALRDGAVNLEQTQVIAAALDALPERIAPEVVSRAEAHLVAEAASFGPRELRVLGRRVLDVVAPEVGEDHERAQLEQEEAEAQRRTFLRFRRNGDGTTDIRGRLSDLVADRLRTYLESFTSPRRGDGAGARRDPATTSTSDAGGDAGGDPGTGAGAAGGSADRRPYEQRLGAAFGSFLEGVDPARLPLHGGDATSVIVTVDLTTLREGLGTALIGDTPITAGQVRRLACTAGILPAVLGGASQVIDLGRGRRLFSPAQRKAMAVRDRTCRAVGCDIPAAWCEAHHAGRPWAQGGATDLADGVLLCPHHHHRAHDHSYQTSRHPDGRISFGRGP